MWRASGVTIVNWTSAKWPHLLCCMLELSLLTDSAAHCYRKPLVPSAGPTYCTVVVTPYTNACETSPGLVHRVVALIGNCSEILRNI